MNQLKIKHILLVVFLFSQTYISAQSADSIKVNTSDTLFVGCNFYKTILSGVETKIRNCIKQVSLSQLNKSGSAEIVRALNKLSTKDKVSHTIWILEEVKNRSVEIRSQVYSDLLKVDYTKPSVLFKPMINSYFTNYKEPEDSLAKQVSLLHGRMIR